MALKDQIQNSEMYIFFTNCIGFTTIYNTCLYIAVLYVFSGFILFLEGQLLRPLVFLFIIWPESTHILLQFEGVNRATFFGLHSCNAALRMWKKYYASWFLYQKLTQKFDLSAKFVFFPNVNL